MSSVKSRLSKIICLVLVAIVAVTAVPLSFAWLANSLEKSADFTSYIHKSYFESGDGTTADQFIDGTHQTEEGCAFEIKYPVQLYYFAWLQALGYFNVPDENGVIQPTYFYLSDDLDMTGFILPQIGTQTYPFVGSFDGNGHTITNLQVQNVETSGGNSWTDKPEDITGLNIVGMFGVIGSLNDAGTVNGAIESGSSFTPTAGYTYSSLTNEVKNFIVDGANIKTDLSESLVGIAAGYVNGTMENVKVVGGTISNVSATTSTSYTTNLSDFGAVGYCTDPYKGTNQVTTVKVYDPQAYTNSGGGTAAGQGNNWGGSVDMLAMYTDLRTVYTSAAGSTNGTYPTAVTITHHTDGTTTETVTGTGTAPLSVTAGGRSYPIRVTEVDDNGDVIASYSIVQRDDTADFVYLYGEKITDTRTAAVTDVYEKDSVYIYHDNDTSHNLSFNGTAFSDAVRASATKWVMEDGENSTKIIYTIVGNNKYYLKNDSGTLSFTSTGLNADIPADATEWNVTDTKIYNDGRYLCYRNGTWQLLLQERLLITDDNEEGSQHFLTVVNGNYANTMVKADAVSWIRTMASDDPDETEFYLHTEIGGNSYYLKQSEGLLVLETNPVTPSTKWKYKAATETEKSKVYTLINDEGDGYALYYDDSDEVKNWALTDFSEVAAGSGSGDSFGDSIPMTAIYNRLSDAYDLAMNEEVTYAPSETVNITKNSQGIVSQTSTTAAETSDLPTIISYSDNDGIGSYSFARHPSGTKQYLYLYGEDDINVNDFAFGYFETYNGNTYITDGAGHYVYYNGSNGLSSSTSRSTAYTYNANNGRISFTSSYTTYYFQFKNGTVSTDTANNSTTTELNGWEVTDGFIHHGNYYLVYADGRWVLRLMKTTTYNFALNGNSYFIKDANDNYLTATASGISNTTSPADAVAWDFSTRSGSGTVSTYIDGTRYYLYRNNTQLGIRDTAYTWTINNNHIYDGNYYVSFNSSWGLTTASTYYLISYGTNYLSTSGSGVENRDEATATRWSLSETAANTNTTISTLIGNTTYYLYVNSSNWTYSLTVNTSSQNWRRSGTATGTLRNRTYTQYYAVYRNNAWTAYNSSSYSLTYTAVTEGQNSALSISQSASYNVYSVVSFHTKPTYLPLSVDSSTG